MKVLNIIDEDIVNYKKISMYIALPFCSMKCNIDAGKDICHNSGLQGSNLLDVSASSIVDRYMKNPLSKAIVIAGLEPFDSKFDLIPLLTEFRLKHNCEDDIVIYTGYTEDELEGKVLCDYSGAVQQNVLTQMYEAVKQFSNIIIKFGRYREGDEPHFDPVLGIMLASDNQVAKVVS